MDKAYGLLDDAAGDDVADLVLGDVFVDLGGDELLHAELDLALFRVNGQDLRLDDLPLAQHFRGVVEAALGGDLADVDQAFDAVGQLDEGSEDRKSTRLNSSHLGISYAVFCLKK